MVPILVQMTDNKEKVSFTFHRSLTFFLREQNQSAHFPSPRPLSMDCVNDDVTLVLTRFLDWRLKENGKNWKSKFKSQCSKSALAKEYMILGGVREFQSILSEVQKREHCNLIMTVNSNSLLVQNWLLDYFACSCCQKYGNRAANALLV